MALLVVTALIGTFIGASGKFIFEQIIPQWRAKRAKRNAIQKYSFPLWRSSKYLLGVLTDSLFGKVDPSWRMSNDNYYKLKTLYFFGLFFGWCRSISNENLKEYIELNPGIKSSILDSFTQRFNDVHKSISDPSYFTEFEDTSSANNGHNSIENSRIPSLVLTCIGELMIKKVGDKETSTTALNFLEFVNKYNTNQEFKTWFDYFDRLFDDLESEKMNVKWNRLMLFYFYLENFELLLRDINMNKYQIKYPFRKLITTIKLKLSPRPGLKKVAINLHPSIRNHLNNSPSLKDLNYYFDDL